MSAGDDATAVDTVLLDVDGTLVDSTYLHAVAWMKAFTGLDLAPQWWRVHRAIGMGGDRLVAEICGADVEEALGDTLRDDWERRYRGMVGDLRPCPGAREFVRSLVDSGLRVALASSGKAEFTDAALKVLDLDRDALAAVTSSDDADSSKPAPDILSVALEQSGGTRAVVVGDTVWDVASAHRLPADCVGVMSGGFAEAELRDAGAVLVVEHVGELAERGWRP